MIKYKLQPARSSDNSLIPVKVIYVDLNLIGTHEAIDDNKFKTVYNSILENGYQGPPISIIEKGQDKIFNDLPDNSNLIIEYGQVGIADGHNRLAALRVLNEEGKLRESMIPVQIIPGRQPNLVRIATLDEKETPLTINEIENNFTVEQSVIKKISTSHFQGKLSTGGFARIRETQPDMIVDKIVLLRN